MSAPIWRVEAFKINRGWGARLIVNGVAFPVCPDAWEWSEAEAQHAVRLAEHAMRAVEVAALREARIACGSNYGEASIDRMIYARLPDCACATDPASVTHNEGTRQHP